MPTPSADTPLPIATRGSPLALAQAHLTRRLLAQAHGLDAGAAEQVFPIRAFVTTGDRLTTQRLTEAGGKGLFTKEIDDALLRGEARISVHSMKDVPVEPPEGIEFAAFLEREDPRDVLLTAQGSTTLADLPHGAVLGTASLRRQAQALHRRPDLSIVTLRGNVGTRLGRLAEGSVHATFLARAGLKRLDRPEARLAPVEIGDMLPAGGQGVIGIAIRADDDAARALVCALDHEPTAIALTGERAALAALDGSCRTPIAIHGVRDGDELFLRAEALTPDGRQHWCAEGRCPFTRDDARKLGERLGLQVREAGGETLARAVAAS